MKKQTAWNGFYKVVKELKEIDKALEIKFSGKLADSRKMTKMRATKYAKSLVFEHGWQDVHTMEYFVYGNPNNKTAGRD